MKKYAIALDEGTTSTRAVLYDIDAKKIVRVRSVAVKQYYPSPSFVEESATEIYSSSLAALIDVLDVAGSESVVGIGVTNQRETVIAWSKATGKPLYNALIWQCRRTADYCAEIEKKYGETVKAKTGLRIDPYFSATKMRWLLDNVPEVADAARKGDLCLGTVDSYLIFRLTDGRSFVTDYTNASRTMLFNVKDMCWDDELLEIFGVKREFLPEVVSPDAVVGSFCYQGEEIPVCGVAGDQQAAAIGQGCFCRGSAKITYGTGMFMLANLGNEFRLSDNGLLTTLGYGENGPVYMFEGSVFNAGSAVQWLRDGLEFFKKSSQSEKLALSVKDNGGVYVVPAFTGLGAPYWVSDATGMITGITRGTTKGHITRAVLEAMAYSARDLSEVMTKEGGISLSDVRVDGGASENDFLMQFQADVLGCEVNRPVERESTALGAVYLCLIGLDIKTVSDVESMRITDKKFIPSGDKAAYDESYARWRKAIERCIYDEK